MTATNGNIDGTMVRRTVIGIFQNRADAEAAINDLKEAGFSRDDIGVAMRDRTAQDELMEETGTQAAEGAAAGVVSGGVLGGIIGALIGAGALVIPGIGPVLAGGALATAFGVTGGTAVAGAGIGAASGGILGGLIGLGIPEDEAEHFERGFRAGGILVTVPARERAPEALAILQRYSADLGPTIGGDTASSTAPSATVGSTTTASSTAATTAAPATMPPAQLSEGVGDEREAGRQFRQEQLDFADHTNPTAYTGSERRYHDDAGYAGPERRLVGV